MSWLTQCTNILCWLNPDGKTKTLEVMQEMEQTKSDRREKHLEPKRKRLKCGKTLCWCK